VGTTTCGEVAESALLVMVSRALSDFESGQFGQGRQTGRLRPNPSLTQIDAKMAAVQVS
jgi:hypothetical protein